MENFLKSRLGGKLPEIGSCQELIAKYPKRFLVFLAEKPACDTGYVLYRTSEENEANEAVLRYMDELSKLGFITAEVCVLPGNDLLQQKVENAI